MSRKPDKKTEERISKILGNKDSEEFKKWNDALGIKFLILFPTLLFLVSFYIFNMPKSPYEFLITLIYPMMLIFSGVILFFVMEK